jgi:hypothetical protein
MKIATTLAALAAALSTAALAADRLEAEGSTSAYYMVKAHVAAVRDAIGVDVVVAPVGTGRAMMDLLEGRVRVAFVTMPLADAVEAGKATAWSDHGRLLQVDKALTYTPMPALDASGRMLAAVTVGAPPARLAAVIGSLSTKANVRTALAR